MGSTFTKAEGRRADGGHARWETEGRLLLVLLDAALPPFLALPAFLLCADFLLLSSISPSAPSAKREAPTKLTRAKSGSRAALVRACACVCVCVWGVWRL